jgi:hypothetical protein
MDVRSFRSKKAREKITVAEPDTDPDPAFFVNADPDPDPRFL